MKCDTAARTDVLVIGAGITGLRAALTAAEQGAQVTVLAKGPRCSWGIGGFNAPLGDDDSPALFYRDIMASGCGVNDARLARILAQDAAMQAAFLERHGMSLDRTAGGKYDLLQPLGCSVPRLVHQGTQTGKTAEEILKKALKEHHVAVCEGVTVLELLSDGQRVYGALALESGALRCYAAKATVVAAGGCGHMYPISTYPAGIQGDSYGMLIRAGCRMTDMEFMQFEPCCLTEPAPLRGRGISTTMLTAGAKLRNARGEEFLTRYFPTLDGVQKGELSRAIFAESQAQGGAPVTLDLTGLGWETVAAHCIYARTLRKLGVDPAVTPLPVLPAAHTFLGGAWVDETCATSLEGLFAAGEAMGGLHGANRIGGCAGAETFVFGAVAGAEAAVWASTRGAEERAASELAADLAATYRGAAAPVEIAALDAMAHKMLQNDLHMIRCGEGIHRAQNTARALTEQASRLPRDTAAALLEAYRVENAAWTALFIATASACRTESRGVFYRSDYPQRDEQTCRASFRMRLSGGDVAVETLWRTEEEAYADDAK